MKRSITKNLNGVSFHDSTIMYFLRTNDMVSFTFDWAKLTYEEVPLIVGVCCLHLFQVTAEEFSPNSFSEECFGSGFSLIGTNTSESDGDLELGGFHDSPSKYSWVEWRCKFSSFKLEWDMDVTLEEWRSGKLPNSNNEAAQLTSVLSMLSETSANHPQSVSTPAFC